MKETTLLNNLRLPARLASEQAATVLGHKPDNMSILIAAGLLKPLGRPKPNSPKYFAASEILAKADDREFLDKAERILTAHWANKNRNAKKTEQGDPSLN